MQGRSIGSKRFTLGDSAEQPTLASIYQEEHTPPAPGATRQRAHAQPQKKALRHGLIASQLGLPMLERPTAAALPESSPQQFAAESDWDEDPELQAALDFDEAQPVYDQYFDAYPPLDIELPPIAAPDDYGYDYGQHRAEQAQAYAEQREPSAPGTYPYARMARESAPPSASSWLTQPPIQRVAALPVRAHSAPRAAAPRPQPAATGVRRVVVAHTFVDDEPVVYPHSRSGLKATIGLFALLAAGFAAYHYFWQAPQAKPLPQPPPPPAAIVAAPPEPPAPAPVISEAAEPASVQATPAPPESAKERRSAARAARAERMRERRAARRLRTEAGDSSRK